MTKITNELTPDGRELVDRLFELDAQYQGGIIKAKSREDFIQTHCCPLVSAYIDRVFEGTL